MRSKLFQNTIALLVCFAVASFAIADITIDVTKHKALTGVESPKLVAGKILIAESSKVGEEQVALITVTATAKFVLVEAERSEDDVAELVRVKEGLDVYLLSGVGSYRVTVTAFDPEAGISKKRLKVEIGTPSPPPDPDVPRPDIPTDAFDNIGQRVGGWAKGLPSNKAIAMVYRQCHPLLTESTQTVNAVTAHLLSELSKVPRIDEYKNVRANINADLQQRNQASALPRGVLADYYLALANGFEGAK